MKNKYQKILLVILIFSAVLRFWNFTQTDVFTDEGSLGIRSLGLIDCDISELQPSAWQWVETIPGWMRLSMSDHPLGIFLIQHFSFGIFGNNAFGLRFPSVVAGVLAIYLIYLIGKKLFSEKVGLLAAFILSFTPYHLWISRVGLQESMVIALILAAFYFFLKSLENKKNLLWVWIFLGLSLIAKYTALILLPIFLIVIIQQKKFKDFFKNKYFWLGVGIFLIIISPSIIYNLKMQQTFGHFDFQISDALNQKVAAWQLHYGRELMGNLKQKVLQLPLNLKEGFSWPMFIVFIAAFFALVWRTLKQKSNAALFLLLTILAWFFWFLIIGSARRFIAYLSPFSALACAWFIVFLIAKLQNKKTLKKIFLSFFILIFIFEFLFSFNTFYSARPFGQRGVLWSGINFEVRAYGFHELEKYLDNLLQNKMPAFSFPPKYKFFEEVKAKNLAQMKKESLEETPLMLIYDNSVFSNNSASLWLFHRRLIYGGWPILDAKTYLEATNEDAGIFSKTGIKEIYFISVVPELFFSNSRRDDFGLQLENILIKQKIQPLEIKNRLNQTVFKIYKF